MERITAEIFAQIPDDNIFAAGVTTNDRDGLFMTDHREGDLLIWVAKKGQADDWVVYTDWIEKGFHNVLTNGQKVRNMENVRKVVPCGEHVINKYRQ